MKISEIIEGGIYQGPGTFTERYVDIMWIDKKRQQWVHWRLPKTSEAKTRNGRPLYPMGNCSVEHFARWAESQIGFDEEGIVRNFEVVRQMRASYQRQKNKRREAREAKKRNMNNLIS